MSSHRTAEKARTDFQETTRNITLVNRFTRRTVEQFPAEPFPFVLVAILTDGMGELQLNAVIQRLDTLDVIYEQPLTVRFTRPLQEIGCIFRIRRCSFPTAGYYQVSLLADHELVAHCRLRVGPQENPS